MVCPKCGSNMSEKKVKCDRCGTDLSISKKIIRASNAYYNTGLDKAKVRDLSGAIVALRKSLELYKAHIDARNLLGLVYYEMGEPVSALSEWVISKHLKETDNDADRYMQLVQSNLTRLDSLNQAIKRYNTALNYAKQQSGDLAIIQLKKVISLNPHFIRAYQLLALLYMKNNENDKARRILFKAQKIDISNTRTLRYLQVLEIPADRAAEGNVEGEKGQAPAIMPISAYREDKPNGMVFVNLVIGILVGVAVTCFLIIPTIKKQQVQDENTQYVDYGSSLAQIEEKEEAITNLQNDNAELEKKIEALQTELNGIVIPESNESSYVELLQVTDLYMTEMAKTKNSRDFTQVVEGLASINESKFEAEAPVLLLKKMREETYPSVVEELYVEGRSLYNNGKHEEALEVLLKAIEYQPENVDVLYFLGRAYHKINDFENAAIYYSAVITDFPDSHRTSNAKSYLQQVQQ